MGVNADVSPHSLASLTTLRLFGCQCLPGLMACEAAKRLLRLPMQIDEDVLVSLTRDME